MAKKRKQFVIDEEQEWIFSYADLMSLLLGLFILLYSTSIKDETKEKAMSDTIGKSFKGPESNAPAEKTQEELPNTREERAFQQLVKMLDLGKTRQEAVEMIEKEYLDVATSEAARKKLKSDLKERAGKNLDQWFSISEDPESIIKISIPSDILFSAGSAVLAPKGIRVVKEISGSLAGLTDLVGIEVSGHTDPLPLSKSQGFVDNLDLSASRANSVARILISAGVSPEKIQAGGRSHYDPIAPNTYPDGRWNVESMRKNRRVQIVIKRQKIVENNNGIKN